MVDGSTATVVNVSEATEPFSSANRILMEADSGDRRQVAFDPWRLAKAQGQLRLGWAYASTVHGCQGVTYLDHNYNHHDIYVAASRARGRTTLVVDARSIDRRVASELPFD